MLETPTYMHALVEPSLHGVIQNQPCSLVHTACKHGYVFVLLGAACRWQKG
jgi:hypothetical protein